MITTIIISIVGAVLSGLSGALQARFIIPGYTHGRRMTDGAMFLATILDERKRVRAGAILGAIGGLLLWAWVGFGWVYVSVR